MNLQKWRRVTRMLVLGTVLAVAVIRIVPRCGSGAGAASWPPYVRTMTSYALGCAAAWIAYKAMKKVMMKRCGNGADGRGSDATSGEPTDGADGQETGTQGRSAVRREDRVRAATHEAGHVVGAWHIPGAPKVREVCIKDYDSGTEGAMFYDFATPHQTREQLLADIAVYLAGHAAETLVHGCADSGTENDLRIANAIARRMVMRLGMSKQFGVRTFNTKKERLSEATLVAINEEITGIVQGQYAVALKAVWEQREQLTLLTNALLERETLDCDDLTKLLGPQGTCTRVETSSLPAGNAES